MTDQRTEAVLAGNFRQYMAWLKENDDGKTVYRYVAQVDTVKGLHVDTYHVVGSATDRADFGELLAAVREAQR